jgi:hypothetical protein
MDSDKFRKAIKKAIVVKLEEHAKEENWTNEDCNAAILVTLQVITEIVQIRFRPKPRERQQP